MSKLNIYNTDFWQSVNLVDEQPVHPKLKLTDTELERRSKISQTSVYKMATDAEFREIKRAAQRKTAEARRVIDASKYPVIFNEYWRVDQPRIHDFKKIYAKKYDVKPGIIELVVDNRYNTVSAEEYERVKEKWNTAFPNYRSDMVKALNKSGRRQPASGASLSATLDSVDANTAQKIYAECLTQADSRTLKNYERLAKLYNISTPGKVRDIANGHHYSLADANAKHDIEQWRLNIGEGNYEMTDPDGVSHMFADLRELGYFIQTQEGKPNSDTTKNWYVARNWFEKLEPNTWYTKQKRTFRGWKYCNHLPAKTG
jgi:hypothetical protein